MGAVPTGLPSSVVVRGWAESTVARSLPLAFTGGITIGVLGGLIGLGGAEFRLPLLIGVFGFVALEAVILNNAMSLVVVTTALPARLAAVPFADLAPHSAIVVNLLAGSLAGAWIGATWATRVRSASSPGQSPASPLRSSGQVTSRGCNVDPARGVVPQATSCHGTSGG